MLLFDASLAAAELRLFTLGAQLDNSLFHRFLLRLSRFLYFDSVLCVAMVFSIDSANPSVEYSDENKAVYFAGATVTRCSFPFIVTT